MVTCSNCNTEIEKNYCPECGQKITHHKISILGMAEDFGGAFFSLDRSVWLNVKTMLLNPGKIVKNYWNGFRNFYFSPNKFLIISALFLSINFLLFRGVFLGIPFNPKNISAQLLFLIIFLPFLTFSSYLTYRIFKKNLVEHLVLNSYSLSIWLLIFSLGSVIINYSCLKFLEHPFLLLFLILIIFWNSRVFELSTLKRLLYTGLNLLIFGIITGGILFLLIRIKYSG
jgi:hypothetical protein